MQLQSGENGLRFDLSHLKNHGAGQLAEGLRKTDNGRMFKDAPKVTAVVRGDMPANYDALNNGGKPSWMTPERDAELEALRRETELLRAQFSALRESLNGNAEIVEAPAPEQESASDEDRAASLDGVYGTAPADLPLTPGDKAVERAATKAQARLARSQNLAQNVIGEGAVTSPPKEVSPQAK